MKIEIDNLTPRQEAAIEDFLLTWMRLGEWGSSRFTAFYADGDGDFRPKIKVNGEKPKACKYRKEYFDEEIQEVKQLPEDHTRWAEAAFKLDVLPAWFEREVYIANPGAVVLDDDEEL